MAYEVPPLPYAYDALAQVTASGETDADVWLDVGIVAGCVVLGLALGAATLRRRTSSGSRPSRSAASSICDSPARLPCGAPKPRNELAGAVFVYTTRQVMSTAGIR